MSNHAAGTIGFLDVGQGDCTVAVDQESGLAILIDCPAGRSKQALRHLEDLGARAIELALVTHSDWDHVGGIYEVLSALPTAEVRINLDTKMSPDNAERNKLRAAQRALLGLVDRGVRVEPAYAGYEGRVGEITWRFLSPTHHILLEAQSRRQRNVASVVVRIEVRGVLALVTGDADARTWRVLLDSSEDVGAAIFRLPHHGGALDDTAGLLRDVVEAVGAELHIVSVGSRNTYGHPSPDVLADLGIAAPDSRVICTQLNSVCQGSADWPLDAALEVLPTVSVRHRRDVDNECPCGGTVVVRVNGSGAFTVDPSTESHGVMIAKLESPMCRWHHEA